MQMGVKILGYYKEFNEFTSTLEEFHYVYLAKQGQPMLIDHPDEYTRGCFFLP